LSPFVVDGCSNYRTSALTRHATSEQHLAAVESHALQGVLPAAVAVARKKFASADLASATALLRTAYYMALNTIPNSHFQSILEYAHLQGANLDALKVPESTSDSLSQKNDKLVDNTLSKYKYCHYQSVLEMHQALSQSISSMTSNYISSSAYVGVITDESTDISVYKKIIFYFRLVDTNGMVNERFVCNMACSGGDALTITNLVLGVLEKFCIPESKIVAITTNGAAVMVERKTGVSTRLNSHYPYLVSIHCHAHKLALCISQAADKWTSLQTCNVH